MDFGKLIDGVIGIEGAYSNNPADKGGPTRWGVTEEVARAYGYIGDMRQFPRQTAVEIFRKRFIQRPAFDQVALRYPDLAAELIDYGINSGPAVAAEALQRSLNVLNAEGRLYGDIGVDSDIGPVTLQALDNYRQRRGEEGGEVLVMAIRCLRGARFIAISESRPANEAFTYGWLKRLIALANGALK